MTTKDEEKSLKGKTALITGASSGIGRATAIKLSQNGVSLSLLARREEKLNEVAEEAETDVLVNRCDVRKENQMKEAIRHTLDEFNTLDIVICNAGVGAYGDLLDIPEAEFQKIKETNMDGVFFTAKNSLPHLKKSGGNLIFIGSFSGKFPRKREPIYAASKWWVRGFAKSLNTKLRKSSVSITVINPSEIRTSIRDVGGKPFEEIYEEGEIPEAGEVGEIILWILKRENPPLEMDFFRRDKLSDTLKG
ncbi:MAG: SDR family oxidoreductase [Candidatus Hadarchaeia archaeon]